MKQAIKFVPTRALGLVQSLLFVLAIAGASFLGVFTPLDGRVNDFLMGISLFPETQRQQILLVDSPVSAFSTTEVSWDQVVTDLVELGARQVVFTVFPEGDTEIAKKLLFNPAVVLGADVKPGSRRDGGVQWNLSPGFTAIKPHAISDTAMSFLGVHRYQSYSYQVNEEAIPSVEALTARRLGQSIPAEGYYLIDFSESRPKFPRVPLQRVVEGSLVKDLVDGRVVLIGIGLQRFHQSVATPITSDGREVTKLEYHGYALDTLLNSNEIYPIAPWATAFLVLVTWIVFFSVAQPFGFKGAMVTGTLMMFILFALAWLTLVLANLHIPVISSVLVIGTTLVSIMHRKAQHHDKVLAKLVNNAGVALSSGISEYHIPQGDELWPYAIRMIDQAVPATRAVLLQRLPNSSELRVAHSLRCTNDAILIPILDSMHSVFKSASTGGSVKEVHLLKPIEGESHQYLVPIVSGSELRGFLLFGTGLPVEQHSALNRAVVMLCRRLAEMLEVHMQESISDKTISNFTRKFMTDERDNLVLKINEYLALAFKQSEFLVSMLNRLHVPTMAYDLFGRPLFTNSSMKAILKETSVNSEQGSSAADLIEETCGLTPDEARQALMDLTVEGKEFNRVAWAGSQQYQMQADVLGGPNLLETSYKTIQNKAYGAMFQLMPMANKSDVVQVHTQQLDVVELNAGLDVWKTLETVVADTCKNPEFQGLTIDLAASRTPALVVMQEWQLQDLLSALLLFLAYDSVLPGRIEIEVSQSNTELTMVMANQGFGMPNSRLQALLDGPVWPQSGTLRRIRSLRSVTLTESESLELTSSLGKGYRVTLVLTLIS
jgi:hypothetical protein